MPASTSRGRSRARLWMVLLLLLCVAGGVWYYKTKEKVPASGSPAANASFRAMRGGGGMGATTPVRIAQVDLRKIRHNLQAIGTVTAFNTVVVRPRVEGELLSLAFNDGDKVEKGVLLAQIDDRSYRISLDQSKAQLAQSQAQLNNAQQDLQRYQQLHKQKSVSQQQLDTQLALVQQLKAAVLSNQATVANAELQLAYTQVHAPVAGRLGLKRVDVGNLVSSANTEGLVVITQTQPISVFFNITQAELPAVAQAMQNEAALDVEVFGADGMKPLATGRLKAIDNQIDIATGTVRLKAEFENKEETLFPNQFVNVRLEVAALESLVVPTAAIQYGSKGTFVYRVNKKNTVDVVTVVAGRSDDGYTAIEAGLSQGDKVVTDGVDRLREGSAVDVITD